MTGCNRFDFLRVHNFTPRLQLRSTFLLKPYASSSNYLEKYHCPKSCIPTSTYFRMSNGIMFPYSSHEKILPMNLAIHICVALRLV